MYITVSNQNIYYQKLGAGKDLIMLHGWGQDVSTFHKVAEELKKDFTLWLTDLPGFGRSEDPKFPFTVSDYADVVSEFIKANKIDKPHLLGHSVGGNISIKLASESGELIDKLVLESSSGIRPNRRIMKVITYPLVKTFHYLVPNIFNIKDKIRRLIYWKLEADYINAGSLKNTLTNILNEDLTLLLPKIKNQTLVLWGEGDEQVKLKYGKQMYRKIPNSKIAVIENSGHFPHIDNPKMFLYYVKDFLK